MVDYRITRPQQLAWLESQLQKLLESEPDPPTHWLVLASQRSLAGMRGQKDLVETLLRAVRLPVAGVINLEKMLSVINQQPPKRTLVEFSLAVKRSLGAVRKAA